VADCHFARRHAVDKMTLEICETFDNQRAGDRKDKINGMPRAGFLRLIMSVGEMVC
jgi:hypothetical protein